MIPEALNLRVSSSTLKTTRDQSPPMVIKIVPTLLLSSLMLGACGSTSSSDSEATSETALDDNNATVSAVSISGESASYTFSVTVASPDTGCNQYAD